MVNWSSVEKMITLITRMNWQLCWIADAIKCCTYHKQSPRHTHTHIVLGMELKLIYSCWIHINIPRTRKNNWDHNQRAQRMFILLDCLLWVLLLISIESLCTDEREKNEPNTFWVHFSNVLKINARSMQLKIICAKKKMFFLTYLGHVHHNFFLHFREYYDIV